MYPAAAPPPPPCGISREQVPASLRHPYEPRQALQTLADKYHQPVTQFQLSESESDAKARTHLDRLQTYCGQQEQLSRFVASFPAEKLLHFQAEFERYFIVPGRSSELSEPERVREEVLQLCREDSQLAEVGVQLGQLQQSFTVAAALSAAQVGSLLGQSGWLQKYCRDQMLYCRIKMQLGAFFAGQQAEVSKYIKRLQPVHSCSVSTLRDILQSGGLRARKCQPWRHRTAFDQIKDKFEGEFGDIFKDIKCDMTPQRASARQSMDPADVPEWWGPTQTVIVTAIIEVDEARVQVRCVNFAGSEIFQGDFDLNTSVSAFQFYLREMGIPWIHILSSDGAEAPADGLLEDFIPGLTVVQEATTRACRHCVHSVLKLAAVKVQDLCFGPSRMGRLWRRELQANLIARDLTYEHLQRIDAIAEDLSTRMDNDLKAGVGSWGDSFLGTDSCCFAVLGPNANYGSASIILDSDIMEKEDASVLINSASSLLSGSSFELRPWCVTVELKEDPVLECSAYSTPFDPKDCYTKVGKDISLASIPMDAPHGVDDSAHDATWRAQMVLRRQVVDHSRFRYTDQALGLFAAEVVAQASVASLGKSPSLDLATAAAEKLEPTEERRVDPLLHGRGVTFDEMRQGLADQGLKGLDKRQLMDHWQSLALVAEETTGSDDVLTWYENVDPHGRIEVLLPEFVPVSHVRAVILPTGTNQELLDSLGSKVETILLVSDAEESLRLQKHYFRSGSWPTDAVFYSSE